MRKIIKVGIVNEFHTYIVIKYMCEILYKRSKEWNSKTSEIHCTDFNALNAKYVEDVEMVFAAFTQHCMQSTDFMSKTSRWCLRLLRNTVCRVQISCRRYSVLCIQWPLAPPGGKARCSCPFCGFSGSPPCSLRRQLCI